MKRLLIIILGLSLLGVSVVSVLAVLDYRNTLARNGRWTPTKTLLEKPVMGAEQFYRDKHALRRNRLDLGAWQGFQEVLHRDSLKPRNVRFRFALLDESYLVFGFARYSDRSEYLGVRLSSYPRFPNAILTIGENGEFLEKRSVDPTLLESARWHSCHLAFNDTICSIRIDDKQIGTIAGDFDTPQRIGFRGGYRNAFVDDVVIEADGGKRIVNESFSNRRGFWVFLCGAVVISLIIDVLVFQVSRRRLLTPHHAFMAVTTFNGVLCFLVGLFWGYFVFVHSKEYPVEDEQLVAREQQFVQDRTHSVSADLTDSCANRSPDVPLVLFLGTSQTWGAGAARAGEDFVSRIQDMLQTDTGPSAFCVNGGVSGQSSAGIVNVYADEWIACEPTVVVANLSHNDNLPDEFKDALRRLVEINRGHSIATVFVTEALSVERFPQGKQTQQVMRDVAREEHIPIVDMHNHLAARSTDGFLWWDHVHPTSFGHKLITERLYPEIVELLSANANNSRGSDTAQ